ncbi:hypothetical protein FHX81_7313 [Saccharothrix saharensis]|uniref:Uncharacterized protein n=1 Tax=Saccharothrix saharensis TaxID=571190 RepID=A0A543JPV4_9PSEU|nr:hypothetical protein [Saccharothrix saharensis]TQM84853.1 hypothetical protein FHX81_7313 [Saccharothrix saharensis]
MYRTTAPTLSRPADARTLGLSRVVRTRATPDRALDDEFSLRHFTDLTSLYGVAVRPDALAAPGTTFTALTRSLHAELEPLGPVELAIVAHATPDLDCRLAAATYLAEAVPGAPLSFSVSDVGRCAPFAALRIASDYAARHGYTRALVVIADQATLPYDLGAYEVADRPAGDAGVALLLEAGGAPVSLVHTPGVSVTELPDAVAAGLASLVGPDERVAVVAGAGIDPELVRRGGTVRTAPVGYPCTALWEGLADSLGRVVLVEHDPVTGDLGLAAVGEVR